jgi:hypothetical protein
MEHTKTNMKPVSNNITESVTNCFGCKHKNFTVVRLVTAAAYSTELCAKRDYCTFLSEQ